MSQIDRVLSSGMTAAQLIEALSEMSPEAVPLFVLDYGDYWHTQQALPVTEVRELEEAEVIRESAYSKSGLALENIVTEGEHPRHNVCVERRDGRRLTNDWVQALVAFASGAADHRR